MVKLKYFIDRKEFESRLGEFINEITDLRFPFGEIVRGWNKYNREQFTLDSSGKYAPLKPSTIRAKIRAHGTKTKKIRVRTTKLEKSKGEKKKFRYELKTVPGVPILVDSGRLRDSLTRATRDQIKEIGKDFLLYGSKVSYGKWLQEGTEFMKPRPFFFLNKQRAEMAFRILETYAREVVGKTEL